MAYGLMYATLLRPMFVPSKWGRRAAREFLWQVGRLSGKIGVSVLILSSRASGTGIMLMIGIVVNAAYSIKPAPLANHKLSPGVLDIERKALPTLSTEKEQGIFGIKYRTVEKTAKDILEEFAKRGW
jgi:hypothetical protein